MPNSPCLYRIIFMIPLLAIFWAPSFAHAALKVKGTAATLEEATNPRPDKGDILLPMPCDAIMTFKAVGTQADGYLWDLETLFGCDDCDRQGADYYERRYSTAISGPFSKGDLPNQWQASLPTAKIGQYYYYLIGKYETTNLQWKIIMEDWCPTETSPINADAARPKTDISWFDAIAFTQKYTEWLLKNHPDSLPRFASDSKNIGYLRMPTENEWEYAARGGHSVPRNELKDNSFFAVPASSSFTEYAVYRSKSAIEENTQPIGSRKANPLGIYDTAGNVAEMVLDTFHFSLGGRLHGSAGGFVKKGGSYLSEESGIMPGRREEVAFFQANGKTTTKDMGLRVAISGINTPAGNRPSILAQEWKKAGEGMNILFDQGKNPLEELDRIVAQTSSPTEKENLQRLRNILKDNNIALERQNEAAADGLIRSSLFIQETVRNYAIRHKNFINLIANTRQEQESAKKMSADMQKAVAETLTQLEKNKETMRLSVDAAIQFYRSKIEDSRAYPEEMFTTRLKLMASELSGDDLLVQNMHKAHTLYSQHTVRLRQGKMSSLSRNALLKDILPENLHEGLDIGK